MLQQLQYRIYNIHDFELFLFFQNRSRKNIIDCLLNGPVEFQYDEDVRAFALTLHFYSPRAYNYVREKFDKHLPHVATIRK